MLKQAVGIGMVFGAGIGIIIGVLFSLNLGLSIVMGSGVGLIVGIVIANFEGKKLKNTIRLGLYVDLYKRIFRKCQYKFESSDCLLTGFQLGELR